MRENLKFIVQRLTLLFVVAGLLFTTSCSDDDDVNSNEIVLLSFGPSGVSHGDEISFIGHNLDKVTSIVFHPDVTVERSEFIQPSGGSFKVVVPEGAEAGKIILNTPQGQVESKTRLNLEVEVVISSITPQAKPGSNIVVKGTKLNWIESVTFASDLVVEQEDFVSRSQTEIVLAVPLEAQTGRLVFATGGTEPLTIETEEELIVTLPTVASLNPTSIKHTENLTITGTNLDLITEVIFGGEVSVVAAQFVSQSETEIVVEVPATVETGVLTLKQSSPIDIGSEELKIILPVGTSVSPSPVIPGEDNLTITGTNLDLVEKLIVPGIGEVSEFISSSPTEIVIEVPEGATQGAISYISIHGYEGPLGVVLKLPSLGALPTLDYYIYKDGLQNGWQAYGGWGHVSQDYANEENPADGSTAIKSVFKDPYGAVQIFNSGSSKVFAGFNYLVFYVYVPDEDSDILVQIGENGDFSPPAFTKNKYHQIVVPLADLAGSDNVTELRIKNNNSDAETNNTTVFIDEIGLTIDEPEAPAE